MASIFGCAAGCGVPGLGTNSLQRHWSATGTTAPTIETTNLPSNCVRAYKCVTSAATGYLGRTVADTTLSGVVAWKYSGTPSAAVFPITGIDASGNCQISMATTGVLSAKVGTGTSVTGPTLSADTWYWISWKIDSSGATTTITASVVDDTGAAVGSEFSANATQASANITNVRSGNTTSTVTCTVFFSGFLIDDDLASYPRGRIKGTRLLPNADGTHSMGAGAFKDAAAVAIDGNPAWDNMDSGDAAQQTEYVIQTVTDTAGYVEVEFGATPETADALLLEFIAGISSDGTGANTTKCVINDNGTLADTWAATDFSDTTQSYPAKEYATAPSTSAAWTKTRIDALKFRFGYGGAIPNAPRCTAMILEVFYVVSAGTNAAATAASGTGTAPDAGKTVAATGGSPSGTGSAPNAPINLGASGSSASGTGAAPNAAGTVVVGGTQAASGAGSAPNATPLVGASGGAASGTGSAPNATKSLGPTATAATGSGTAAQPSTDVKVNAGSASGTGTAPNASAATAKLAAPTSASGTGSAPNASTSVAGTATPASGTGAASGPSSAVAPTPTAASGAGSAVSPNPSVRATAGSGSATGAAVNPTVSVQGGTDAPAGSAQGTGTAPNASVDVKVNAGSASGTGAASNPSTSVAPSAGASSGAGSAVNPNLAVATGPSAASGTGTASNATVTTTLAPTWTTPGDGVLIGSTPELRFTIPALASPMHFNMQLDTDSGFGSGALRDIKSNVSQTGWEYWNGSAWTPVPSGGVNQSFAGNEARHTIQTALAPGTWYRRVRAGVST